MGEKVVESGYITFINPLLSYNFLNRNLIKNE